MLTAKTTVGDGRWKAFIGLAAECNSLSWAGSAPSSVHLHATFTRDLPSFQNVYYGGRLWQSTFEHKSQHQIPQSVKLYKITHGKLSKYARTFLRSDLAARSTENVRDFDDCGPWLKIVGTAPSFSNRRRRRIDGFCPIKR